MFFFISSIDIDKSGNIFAAGACDNGNVVFGNHNSTAPFSYNTYFVKYNNTGNYIWSNFIEDITFQKPDIMCDNSDNLIAAGDLNGSFLFGAIQTQGRQWAYDFFLTKINPEGIFQWVKEVPNTSSITGDVRKSKINSISVDLQNNIYFSGSLRLTMNWGNNVNTTSRGSSDIILLKYDSKGNIISGKTAGGTGSDRCDDISLSSSGNIFLSGNFSSTALFDTISVTGSGNINSFLTKISSGNIAGNINLSVIPQGFYNFSSNKLNIIDTVKIYIRNSVSPYSISDSSVSVIDSSTYKGSFQFMNAISGNYYIQLRHRNTLKTWSSFPVNYISGEINNYNFTDSLSKAYGNNQIQVSNVNDLYAIYSGDVNQDGIIDAADLSEVDNDIINSATGYLPADLNGDGFVEVSDLSMVENNSSAGIQIVKP